ncbi:MAG TPA: hypothetical protein VF982_11645, partial [Anaerolineales bacterium]
SGGSAAALEDASLAGLHAADKWKGGALFISRAGGAAPEGEFAAISTSNGASGEFTLAASLGAAIEPGDRYGVSTAYYPLETMIELANAGLRALGDIPLVDDQTLVTGGGGSFVATLDWTRRRPLRIDYLAIPGLTAMDPWRTVYDWDFVPAAPGNPGLILFADALPAGRPLRVWYQAAHPKLNAYADALAGTLAPELAVAAGLERALRWQHARLGSGDDALAARWGQAQSDLAAARRHFPVWRPHRTARMLNVNK